MGGLPPFRCIGGDGPVRKNCYVTYAYHDTAFVLPGHF